MAKTLDQIKGQWGSTDPRQQAHDLVDAVAGVATALKFITVDGRNLAGAVTATGAAVGDRVIGVAGLTGGQLGDKKSFFQSTITIVNQIQQTSATDQSANDFLVVLAPAV